MSGKTWLDKYGYPLERVKGRSGSVRYFFRVLLCARRRGFYGHDGAGRGWTVTTERGTLRRKVHEALQDENGLSFEEAILAAFEALRSTGRFRHTNHEKPCPLCGMYEAPEQERER